MSFTEYRRGGRQMNLSTSERGNKQEGGESSDQDSGRLTAEGQSYRDCRQEINRLNDEDLEAYRRMQ